MYILEENTTCDQCNKVILAGTTLIKMVTQEGDPATICPCCEEEINAIIYENNYL